MLTFFGTELPQESLPIHVISLEDYLVWKTQQADFHKKWLEALTFEPSVGKVGLLPHEKGGISAAVLITTPQPSLWEFAELPSFLPAGFYHFSSPLTPEVAFKAALAWGLGCYTFEVYKKAPAAKQLPILKWPPGVKPQEIMTALEAIKTVRDLITTPACDMTPQHLAAHATQLARAYQASVNIIIGEDLLKHNYPTV